MVKEYDISDATILVKDPDTGEMVELEGFAEGEGRVEFQAKFEGHFEPPDYDALEAFLVCAVTCEEFDRRICRYFSEEHQTAIPQTPREEKACMAHARAQHELVCQKLNTRYPRKRYRGEWRQVSEMTFEQQKQELERVRKILDERE